MNQILQIGQTVWSDSGVNYNVESFLGGGRQGEVYKATIDGKPMALKWYFPTMATEEQHKSLERIVGIGKPSDKFLWPEMIVIDSYIPSFGYIMPLRDPKYKGIVDLMNRKVDTSFKALATAGIYLSDSFYQLHSKGLSYSDISFGNVFFDPVSGDVLICDCDNVTIDGTDSGCVLGTPRFMAPEIVMGKAKPSSDTDRFSLAILLFYMFFISHPLEGKKEAAIKCFDLPAMRKLYGTEPLFIFDPKDRGNEPVPGMHDNAIIFWPIYPKFLRDLFTKTFTEGIKDSKNGRVRESQWRSAMSDLRDAIFYCSCGAENFFDEKYVREGKKQHCWSCNKDLTYPPRIEIGKNVDKKTVMLNFDTKLYPHHVSNLIYDFSKPVAIMNQHPRNPNIWGLKNIGSEKWIMTSRDGKINDIEPGRSVPISVGVKINFGSIEGEIKA